MSVRGFTSSLARRGALRVLRWLAGGILALLVVVYLLAPMALGGYLPVAAQRAGVALELGGVSLHPFARTVALADVDIDTGAGVALTIGTLVAEFDAAALLGGHLRIDGVRVAGVAVRPGTAANQVGAPGPGEVPDVGVLILESLNIPWPGVPAVTVRRVRVDDLGAMLAGTPTPFVVEAVLGTGRARVEGHAAMAASGFVASGELVAEGLDPAALSGPGGVLAGQALGVRAALDLEVASAGVPVTLSLDGAVRTEGLSLAAGGVDLEQLDGVWHGRIEVAGGGEDGVRWTAVGDGSFPRLVLRAGSAARVEARDATWDGRIEGATGAITYGGALGAATIELAAGESPGWQVTAEEVAADRVEGRGAKLNLDRLHAGTVQVARGDQALVVEAGGLEVPQVVIGDAVEVKTLNLASARIQADAALVAGGLQAEALAVTAAGVDWGERLTLARVSAARLTATTASASVALEEPVVEGLDPLRETHAAGLEVAALVARGEFGVLRAEGVSLADAAAGDGEPTAARLEAGQVAWNNDAERSLSVGGLTADRLALREHGFEAGRVSAASASGEDAAGRIATLDGIGIDALRVGGTGSLAAGAFDLDQVKLELGALTLRGERWHLAAPRVEEAAFRAPKISARQLVVTARGAPAVGVDGLELSGLSAGFDGAASLSAGAAGALTVDADEWQLSLGEVSATKLQRSPEGVVSAPALGAARAELGAAGKVLAKGHALALSAIEVAADGGYRAARARAQAFDGTLGASTWRLTGVDAETIEGGQGISIPRLRVGIANLAEGGDGAHIDAQRSELTGLRYLDGALAVDSVMVDGLAVAAGAAAVVGVGNFERVTVEDLNWSPASGEVRRVGLRGARLGLGVDQDGTWLAPRLPALGAGSGPPVRLRVAELALDGPAQVVFIDRRMKPLHRVEFEVKRGTLDDLDTGAIGHRAPFHIEAERRQFWTQSVDGVLSSTAAGLDLEAAGKVRGLNLVVLSPYAARNLGLDISGGRADIDFEVSLADGELDGSSQLKMSRVQLADHAGAADGAVATGASLRATLAMLTDKQGTLNLEVGFAGSADDPEFEFGDLYAKALAQTAKSALMLYLQPVGLAFAAKGIIDKLSGATFRPLVFDAGSGKLGAEALTYLDELGARLGDRPGLVLEVCASAVGADADALAAVARQAAARGEPTPARTLDALAEARANAVRGYLREHHQVPARQLLECAPTVTREGGGGPRVDLKLVAAAGAEAPAPEPAADR